MLTQSGKPKPLKFRNALRLKIAENWLLLGQVEEALLELSRLPYYARNHPEVLRLKEQMTMLPAQLVDLWLSRSPARRGKGPRRKLVLKAT